MYHSTLDDAFGVSSPDFTTSLAALPERRDDALVPELAELIVRIDSIRSPVVRLAYGRTELRSLLYRAPDPVAFEQTTRALFYLEREAQRIEAAPEPPKPHKALVLLGASLFFSIFG